jgi:hypothetical protein
MTYKILYIPLLILFSFAFSVNLEAQNCRGFEKRCDSAPKYFESSTLSRSISIRRARKVIVNQTFYGDREYFISVCGRNRLGKIHFRLISDDENQTILYDNAADNFKDSQIFLIQTTMRVKIELSAPHYFDETNSECAGLRIFFNRSQN